LKIDDEDDKESCTTSLNNFEYILIKDKIRKHR